MRLNRKWLYLGGLIAMLTLLLTLTWVLPAGAVGRLDNGDVTANKSFVSPDGVLQDAVPTPGPASAGTIQVTVTNSDLDSTMSVSDGGDIGPINIHVDAVQNVTATGSFRVLLGGIENAAFDATSPIVDGTNTPYNTATTDFVITIPDGPDDGVERDSSHFRRDDILPIVGNVVIDTDETAQSVRNKLGAPRVINASTGLIEFPLIDTIAVDDNADIVLSYNTSNQETALVNVRGDNDDFDLLLVEGSTPGEYSETFVAVDPDKVLMNPGAEPATTVDGVSYGVIHEQHTIPSGKRGYVEFENERLTKFYGAYQLLTGTLSEGNLAADIKGNGRPTDTTHPDGAQPNNTDTTLELDNTVGLDDGEIFYARVANPPIREVRDATPATPTITVGTAATDDLQHEAVTGVDVALVSAQQGILSFTVQSGAAGFNPATAFSRGDVEVDYVGSETITITVDNGPINLTGITDGDRDTDSDIDLDDIDITEDAAGENAIPEVAAGEIKIILPTTDDDTASPDADNILTLVSIENDGNRCNQCKIRLGVTVGPKSGEDDPVTMDARYSVLGISYVGAERHTFKKVTVPRDTTAAGDGTTDTYTHTFAVNLKAPPVDTDPNTVGMQHDIVFAYTIAGVPAVDDTTAGLSPLVVAMDDKGTPADTSDDTPRISGRQVWVTTTVTRSSNVATTAAVVLEGTFDVTYTRKVGSLPRNALNPDAGLRPVTAVGSTGRVLVTSGNDSLRINSEGEGPKFSNPAPAHDSATRSTSEMISIDVTDAQAGVDKKTIMLMVTAGTGNEQVVDNKDLTITEIDNGYRASIALNKVRHDATDPTLSVSATADTPIAWSATAKDKAGNIGNSDSKASTKDVNDDYTFRVDGVAPVMERAYTGDWFNSGAAGDGRVEGDRLISPDNYLPGKSKKTSIRVVFSEAIDNATVEPGDFTVNGTAPSAAVVYAKGDTKGAGEEPNEDTVAGAIGRSVFLTVPAMGAGDTPEVVLTGSVSDKAGNPVSSGTKTAEDGIAPGATLSVDKTLSDESVTITVTTDEDIGAAFPELKFWVSDAIDSRDDTMLHEKDTFTVGLANPEATAGASNPLVLRNSANQIVFSGDLNAAGDLGLTLSKAPILDWSTGERDGDVDGADIEVMVVQAEPSLEDIDPKVVEDALDKTVVNPKSGRINLKIQASRIAVADDPSTTTVDESKDAIVDLANGDKIVVTYRGTDPDPANQLTGVEAAPSGRRASDGSNSWTYSVDFTRTDRFAVTAVMEDDERNQGSGGIANPKTNGATVFEIDNQLAGNSETDATSTPADEPSGANPVAFEDPFDIELSWPNEANEYVGDSNSMVNLTKAELDGVDVMEYVDRQNAYTFIISVEEISLGQHTLTYKAEDAAGNTSSSDRTLEFTVKERPTWDLRLRKGNNLISIPADPSNGDINEVFGGVSEVELVYTFEGSLVQVAIPGPDGQFIGALDTIDSRHAYWVSASSAVTIPINIGTTGTRAVLPSLQVKGGQWNLLPVMSLGGVDDATPGSGAKAGTPVDPDAYLGDFQVAFTSERGRWMRIDPDGPSRLSETPPFDRLTDDLPSDPPNATADASDTPLKVGMGYWVLYTEDAFITPR